MISRRAFLPGIIPLVPALSSWAQDTTFSADVKVVSLIATVRDRSGRVIRDLTKEDFLLFEDGEPQEIRYFSRESDLPLTLGLLVDTSRSQSAVIDRERSASYTFLSQVLREKVDQAFVVSFDKQVQVLQGMTSSRQDLAAALGRLKIPGIIATLLYEAVRQSSENFMRREKGRKALILLSDGVSFRDRTTIGTAIEFAQRADTIVYAIRFSGEPVYHPARALVGAITSEAGKHALERMTSETGGATFQINARHTIENVFSEIEEWLRNQYNIGYTPAAPGQSGKYHKIKLATKREGLIVGVRDGYYSQ